MKSRLRTIGLAATLAATLALAAGPAVAVPENRGKGPKVQNRGQGQGPKVITGNPPKTTVIHCKRAFPGTGANGVMILKVRRDGVRFRNNCRGVPENAKLPQPVVQRLLEILGNRPVPPGLQPFLP